MLGERVLLIDLDPQASLTFSFTTVEWWRSRYTSSKTIKNWYDAFINADQNLALESLIVHPARVNQLITNGSLDLICSHLGLINLDLELATMLGGATIRQIRNNFLRVHSRLAVGMSALPDDSYDHVLIDCPPNFNIVTKTAIVTSDYILIPAIPDYLSTLGIDELQRHVSQLVQDYNEFTSASSDGWTAINPATLGVITTMIGVYGGQPNSTQRQYLSQLRRSGIAVFDTYIRKNDTKYGGAPEHGIPVVLQSASGQTYEAVRGELEDLTGDFLRRLG